MPRANAQYAIIDEPVPSRLTHLAVLPMFPLLASMLGGAWIGWLWFGINAYAFGSPNRNKELAIAVLTPLLIAGLYVLLMIYKDIASYGNWGYAWLAVDLLKLTSAYLLFGSQSSSFQVYQHFGGRTRSGLPLLALSFMFGRKVLRNLPEAAIVVFS